MESKDEMNFARDWNPTHTPVKGLTIWLIDQNDYDRLLAKYKRNTEEKDNIIRRKNKMIEYLRELLAREEQQVILYNKILDDIMYYDEGVIEE